MTPIAPQNILKTFWDNLNLLIGKSSIKDFHWI